MIVENNLNFMGGGISDPTHKSDPSLDQPIIARHKPNAGLMLGHRLRRWTNIKATLEDRRLFVVRR